MIPNYFPTTTLFPGIIFVITIRYRKLGFLNTETNVRCQGVITGLKKKSNSVTTAYDHPNPSVGQSPIHNGYQIYHLRLDQAHTLSMNLNIAYPLKSP